jgi:cytochrome c-type biogenesis protein CcmE
VELTPRTGPDADPPAGGGVDTRPADRSGPPRPRRVLPIALLVVVVVAGGYVVLQALGSAATFYRNVDEAVAQQQDLGTKRFRLQGTVVPGSITRTGAGVDFAVTYDGVELPVQHRGDPPEMFEENEPVLLEGHFVGDGTTTYASDLIIVKHDEDYIDHNEDRLKDAEEGGKVAVSTGSASSSNGSSEAGGS